MDNPTTAQRPPRYATVGALVKMQGYEWLTPSAIRHLIFKATPRLNSKGEKIPTNGLFECGAIIKIGRKILIDADRFDHWVSRHRQG